MAKTLQISLSNPGSPAWPQTGWGIASCNRFQTGHAPFWNSGGKFPEAGERKGDIKSVNHLILMDWSHRAAELRQFSTCSFWTESIWSTWAHLGSNLPCGIVFDSGSHDCFQGVVTHYCACASANLLVGVFPRLFALLSWLPGSRTKCKYSMKSSYTVPCKRFYTLRAVIHFATTNIITFHVDILWQTNSVVHVNWRENYVFLHVSF